MVTMRNVIFMVFSLRLHLVEVDDEREADQHCEYGSLGEVFEEAFHFVSF